MAVLALAFASTGFGTVLYSYGLPSGAGVNSTGLPPAGPRINYDVASYATSATVNGDTFTLASYGAVKSISIFAVANNVNDTTADEFAAEFGGLSNIILYGGQPDLYTSSCGSANTCNFAQIATATLITPVSYTSVDGSSGCNGTTGPAVYQSTTSGACLPIFEISFNVDLSSYTGGVAYGFAANGAYSGGGVCDSTCDWYNLGSTVPGAGTGPYSGTNSGYYLNWDASSPYYLAGGSEGCLTTNDPSTGCQSDYNFNLNVIVSDTAVIGSEIIIGSIPEPTSLTLSGLGIGVVAFAAWRKRKVASQSNS